MQHIARTLFLATLAAASLSACSQKPSDAAPTLAQEGWAERIAPILGAQGAPIGEIQARQAPSGIILRLSIAGLEPGWHGVHLHQTADCSDFTAGFKASGSHIDPAEMAHGLLNPDGHEVADLPNLFAPAQGSAMMEAFKPGVSFLPSEAAAASGATVLLDEDGFAVIIHENADDHLSQPIGGAGRRLGCAAFTAQNE